jgi:hypothetical protein
MSILKTPEIFRAINWHHSGLIPLDRAVFFIPSDEKLEQNSSWI